MYFKINLWFSVYILSFKYKLLNELPTTIELKTHFLNHIADI